MNYLTWDHSWGLGKVQEVDEETQEGAEQMGRSETVRHKLKKNPGKCQDRTKD